MNKKAIIYSLTNIKEEDIKPSINYNKMKNIIDNNLNIERNKNKEYYYLYIDKKDSTIIIKSILDIQSKISNPSNIFQINWTKEKDVKHIFNDFNNICPSKNQIYDVIKTSLKKYLESFNDFINE